MEYDDTRMFRYKRRMKDMKWKRQREADKLLLQYPPKFLKINEELKKINNEIGEIKSEIFRMKISINFLLNYEPKKKYTDKKKNKNIIV